MKLAVGSDEKTSLTDLVLEELRKLGHNVSAYGPMAGEQMGWPDVGEKIGLEVSSGRADQGIAFCWTGTGVCIAANKVPRCSCGAPLGRGDCEGGEALDDANVLAMC